MALLSNFLMPRGGVQGPDPLGMMTNRIREGDGGDSGGGAGGGGGAAPTTPTEPPPETPPEAPPVYTPGPPAPVGENPGGPGPSAPQPVAPPTTALPMGGGVIGLPGQAGTAPGRTGEFMTNRFVGGPAEDPFKRQRQGPGIPGQPGNVVPTDAGGMPSEDMLRNIVERMRRRTVAPSRG